MEGPLKINNNNNLEIIVKGECKLKEVDTIFDVSLTPRHHLHRPGIHKTCHRAIR